ncbi:MAG: M20/M25/M40 family metallo-hydrolase [Chitinophagaceae bacterium]|nr:M20/M25/M40 family metallo-hydrolase [Chitinophagaceae bacterium]
MKKILLLISLFYLNKVYSQPVTVNRDTEIEQMVQEINPDSLRSYITHLVAFGTRHTLSSRTNPKTGIGAARNYVLQKFREFASKSDGRLRAFIDTVTLPADGKRINRPVLLGNVMGVLKGTDPNDNRILIISGHLDSRRTDVMDSVGIAPGADDDGSGTAAVMECARVMSQHSFPATVIFVAVSGEEQGLLGSTFLANKAKKENWNVAAMLNNDIVGSNNSSGTNIINNTEIRVFSEGIPHYKTEEQIRRIISLGLENDGNSRQLARYVKETAERYVDNLHVILEYRTDRFLRGGDHLPFLNNGFTAVRLTEMNENFTRQHQDIREENGISYGDLTEHIDFEYLRKNTGVNLSTLANLAKAPGKPQNVKIEVRQLTNFTDLKWEAPANKKVSGYYVLIRKTAESIWQKKFFTKDTSIRLPYSKDNYFFAVEAVSETGNESLPVVPGIGR